MKGHVFIKTNDKLGGAAEKAPDNVLYTTAKKNPNKLRAAKLFFLAEVRLVKKSPTL
jgi:hypothetical protein